MFRKIGSFFKQHSLLALLALLAMVAPSAMADTDVTALVTDASTVWASVKVVVLGVVGFLILIAIVKLVKKR